MLLQCLHPIGAINALQDAVILANCIYDITSATPENIHEAFADYRSQRYPKAKYQIDKSKVMATIQYGQVMFLVFVFGSFTRILKTILYLLLAPSLSLSLSPPPFFGPSAQLYHVDMEGPSDPPYHFQLDPQVDPD